MTKASKRVGKPQGVTDKDVIVAQKKAEKEQKAAEENNPLKQVYRDDVMIKVPNDKVKTIKDTILSFYSNYSKSVEKVATEQVEMLSQWGSSLNYSSDEDSSELNAVLFRSILNYLLFIQRANMKVVRSLNTHEPIGYVDIIDSTPLNELLDLLFELHLTEIEKGNTVHVDILRQELVEKQNEIAPKMEVSK